MDSDALFRQKPSSSIPRGVENRAEDANPSELSGTNTARIGTPVWRQFVADEDFQRENAAPIQAEFQQQRQEQRAARQSAEKWGGDNGRLFRKTAAGIEQFNAEEYGDDPNVGAFARKSVWDMDKRRANAEHQAALLALQNPDFKSRELPKKDREAFLAEGSMLAESDPRHVELKQKLIDDDAFQAEKKDLETRAYQAKVRAFQIEQTDPDTHWMNRKAEAVSPSPEQQRATEVQSHQEARAKAEAADQSAAVDEKALDAELANGVTAARAEEIKAIKAETARARQLAGEKKAAADAGIEGVKQQAQAQTAQSQEGTGDFLRGAEVSLRQIPQLAYGVAGLIGDTMEKTIGVGSSLRDWGLKGYADAEQKAAPLQRDHDDVTKAWAKAKTGDLGALVDWAQYGLGYAFGQLGETLAVSAIGGVAGAAAGTAAEPGGGTAVGGAGGALAGVVAKGATKSLAKGLIEKAIASQATKLAAKALAKDGVEATAEAITKRAADAALRKVAAKELGSNVAVMANALGMEIGSIYPEAVKQAQAEGRELTGTDLARVWGTGLAAGGIEGLTDKLGIDLLKGKFADALPGGRIAGAAVGGLADAAVEGGTEAVQTGIERLGARQSLTDSEAQSDYINSAAMGAIGGAAVGGFGGAMGDNTTTDPDKFHSEVSTAVAAIDPEAPAPAPEEISKAMMLVNPSDGAAGIADAVLIERELAQVSMQDDETLAQAEEAVAAAKATGDTKAVKAAEEAKAGVQGRAEGVRAVLKIAAGQQLDDLTSAELASIGFKDSGDSFAPMTAKELKDAGISSPLIRQGADGSIIITDGALKKVGEISPRARARVTMTEAEAIQKAKQRASQQLSTDTQDGAAGSTESATSKGVPGDPVTGNDGFSPDETNATVGTFDVPMRDGTTLRVQAKDGNAALEEAAAQAPISGQPATPVSNVLVNQPSTSPTADNSTTGGNDPSSGNAKSPSVTAGVSPESNQAAGGISKPSVEKGSVPQGQRSSPAKVKLAHTAAKSRFDKAKKKLKDRLIEGKERAVTRPEGITINPKQIVEEAISRGMTEKQAAKYFARVLDEEVRHLAQYDAGKILFRAAGSPGNFLEWMEGHYAAIWKSDFVATGKDSIVRDIYAKTETGTDARWDSMSDGDKAIEAIRMMSQGNSITEQGKLWADISEGLKKAILAALRALKQFRDIASPAIQSEITNLENALKTLSGTSKPKPTDGGNSQNQQSPGNASSGNGQTPETPSAGSDAGSSGVESVRREAPASPFVSGAKVEFEWKGKTRTGTIRLAKNGALSIFPDENPSVSIGPVAEKNARVIAGPKVHGEQINGEWTAFAPESGTIGIPRAMMPQIKAGDRSALVQFLKARGVDYTEDTVPASSLKPTQTEFSPAKVEKAKAFEGGNRSILVSSDDHVLDGHHQWMAALEKGEEIPVIRIDAPIRKLLPMAMQMPSATVDGGEILDAPSVTPSVESSTEAKPQKSPESNVAPTADEAIDQMAENTRANLDAFAAETKRLQDEQSAAYAEATPRAVRLHREMAPGFKWIGATGMNWATQVDEMLSTKESGERFPTMRFLSNWNNGLNLPLVKAFFKEAGIPSVKGWSQKGIKESLENWASGQNEASQSVAKPDSSVASSSNGQTLSEADQALLDAMDGLFAAALPESFTKPVPPDRIGPLVTVATKYLAEGVNTPEALAKRLGALAEGKMRPFSQSIWFAFKMAGVEGVAEPNWAEVYGLLDKPSAKEDGSVDDTTPQSDSGGQGPEASSGLEPGVGGPMDSKPSGEDVGAGTPQQLPDDGVGAGKGGNPASVRGNASRPGGQSQTGEQGAPGTDSKRGGKRSPKGTDSINTGDGSRVAGGEQPTHSPGRTGYRLTDPERIIGTGGPKARFARNKLALETFDTVLSEQRDPTPEEQDILAAYIGWGSFGQELFQGSWDRPNPKPEWQEESDWLRDHLGQAGWESIRDSIINAHYTDPPHVQALWRIAEHLGFKGGRVLEPSMGIGSFFGLMPDVLRAKSSLTGIELDRVVGGMAQMLYPDANIRIMGYEKSATADGFYDLVIGNWPFAKDGPSDPRYNSLGLSLHDYFFVKALDQVRPGGLVIGITSSGTMDKKGQTARRQMARRAELVGAFRFPSGAFEKYAGTKVVTDVVILKKRSEAASGVESDGWINTEEFGTGDQKFNANEYWRKHPDHVLGEMTFGHGTTQGRAGMIVNRPSNYAEILATVENALPKDILTESPAAAEKKSFQNRESGADQNSVTWNEGDGATPAGFYVVRGEQLEPLEQVFSWKLKDETKTEKRRDELKKLLGLRQSVHELLAAQRDGDPKTEDIRKTAKARYDSLVKAHGPIGKSFMVKAMTRAGDPMALTLENLERFENGKYVPREILLKDIMRRPVTDAKGSIEDAYAIQRNQSTALDVESIAEISGSTVAEVIDRLVSLDQIYRTPSGVWESREEYLGGNVRRKLREAKDAKSQGLDMDRNIAALEVIQPKDVAYFEIEVQMGASWIPRENYLEFASHLLGGEPSNAASDFELTKASSGWNFKVVNKSLANGTNANATWGTARISFSKIFQAAMNGTTVKIYDTTETKAKVINEQETELANKKIDDIREELTNWLWSDPERTGKLASDYNEVMNSEVVPQRSGSHLRFEGLALTLGSSEFDFRQHQKDAVWRFIMDGRGVGAHEVGTGKTFTMAGLAVEGRRLGKFRKSLVFAHNANSESVFRDFQAAYPGGKFLYIDNLSPENRDNAMRQIATDEWDAIVVPHSLIDRFALREETLMEIANKQIIQMESEIADALDELGVGSVDINDEEDVSKKLGRVKDSHTAKELVKARNRIIKRIKDKAAKGHKDNAVFFEDLGVDSIMVDEAHMFKKIALATRKEVKGLNKTESERGWMLGALTDTIKARNNGKGVFLFTGTPLTNNLNEAYNMMRFVMDDAMSDVGIDGFDDWFNAFAASVTDVELTTGGTFEPVSRLLSFINVPELARLAGRYFDVVLAKNMPEFVPRDTEDGKSPNAIGRPFKKVRPVTSEMSPEQKAHKADIQRRYEWFQKLQGRDKRKAMLRGENTPIQLETEGIKAALDMRMVNHSAEDYPDSKVNMMIRNAIDHYLEDPASTQMIFMEQGWNDFTDAQVAVRDGNGIPLRTDDGKKVTRKERRRQFNLVRDMVEKLVAKGVRPEEIAVFSNMSLDPIADRPGDVLRRVNRVTGKITKEDLAAQMREGKIRFAIGSTQTMGTGVNAQNKMRAMHHLDAPWTPGEFEQRNGRGHRQGNEWNTVFEYRYFTEGSHDGRRWQVLLNKVKFISRFTDMLIDAGGSDLRVLAGDGADLGEEGSNVSDFEQSFSTAAGDPRILVRAKLRTDVDKLERKRDAHFQSIARAKGDIKYLLTRKEREGKTIAETEKVIETVTEAREKPFAVTIDGKTFTERKDAEEYLAAYPSLTQKDDGKEIMDFHGIKVMHDWNPIRSLGDQSGFYALVPIKGGSPVKLRMGKLSIASLENNLRGQTRTLANMKESFDGIDASVASLEEMIRKPFTREPELEAKTNALQQIEVELNRAPQPAPSWLRNGAPVGSLVYLEDGKAYDVAAHRWDENGWWVLVEDGTGMRPIDYRKVLDDSGHPMFEDVPFVAPDSADDEDSAVSDDTAAFGKFIDKQEGRGLSAAALPTSLRLSSPEWKAMSTEQRREYLNRKKGGLNAATLPETSKLVTPEQDRAYLDAVERGDMATAQQMVDMAAESAGYKTPVSHQTNTPGIQVFDRNRRSGRGDVFEWDNIGTWTTGFNEKRIYGDISMPLYGSMKNPLRYRNLDAYDKFVRDYLRIAYPEVMHELNSTEVASDEFVGLFVKAIKRMSKKAGVGDSAHSLKYQQWLKNKFPGADGFRDYIKSQGYDGIQVDGAFWDGELQTVRIFLDPDQLKSAAPVTRDSEGEVIPLSERFNPAKDSILYAATLPEPQNLDTFKKRGFDKVDANRKLIKNAEDQVAAFGSGSVGADPKFANPGMTQASRDQIDIARAIDSFQREVRKDSDTFAKAAELLAKDPAGVEELALGAAFGDGRMSISDHEQLAIEMLMNRRMEEAGGDRSKQIENYVLAAANIMNRRETARTLRIGFDKFMKPEERALQQIADAIFTPTAKVEQRAKTMPLSERKAYLAQAGEARIADVEAALKKLGLRLDQVVGKNRSLQLENSQLMKDVLKLRNALEQDIIRFVQKGASLKDINRRFGKLGAEQAKGIIEKARADLFAKIDAMSKSGMTRDQIREAMKDGLKAAPLGSAASGMSADEIWKMIEEDFGLPGEIPAAPLPTAKPKKPKAPVSSSPHPLSADWSRPEFTDGMNSYTFDTKDRSGIMERVEIIRGLAGALGKIDGLTGDKRAKADKALSEINEILKKYGTDAAGIFAASKGIEEYGFDINDVAQVAAVARAINAIDADFVDKATEYLYFSMLSGLQTMLVNATALVPAAWESTVGRGVELAINAFVRDPMSVQYGEAKYILKALAPAISRAKSNFQAAMAAQHPMFDRDVNAMEIDWDKILGGGSHRMIGSITGKKGDIIRLPMRLLTATDDFNRTLIACAEVGTFAYRLAKAKGMKPGSPEMDRFIRVQVNTPGSLSYHLASQKASRAIYSNPLPGQQDPHTGKKVPVNDLGDIAGFVASKLTSAVSGDHDNIFAKAASAALRIAFFPFQRTPFNILRKGIRHTLNPISLFDIAVGVVQNSRKDGGGWEWNSQKRNPELIERMGQQLQGAVLMAIIAGVGAGEGDDDDQNKRFIITGSSPFLPTGMAERDARMRSGLGPFRVSFRRKDGSERFGFNYGRLEPLATTLAASIDIMKSAKRAMRGGGDGYDASMAALGGFVSQAQDKSFMKGIGDFIALASSVMAEPDLRENRKALQFLAGRVAMVVPNFIKQPIREADSQFRERSNGFLEELMYQAIPYGQKPAKVDPYGHTMEKPGNAAGRILDVTDAGTDTVHPTDAMLLKWSDKHPDKAWFPSPILNAEFKHPKTGQNVKMTGEQLAEFRAMAGKRLNAILKREVVNFENPSMMDVEKVKEATSQARSEVKKILAYKYAR